MLNGFELCALFVNEQSTWSSVFRSLLVVIILVFFIAWAGGGIRPLKRGFVAVSIAGLLMFSLHLFGNVDFIQGDNESVLKELRKTYKYHDIEKVLERKIGFSEPATLLIKRRAGRNEIVYLDSGPIGFGKKIFFSSVADNNWSNHVYFEEDANQAATNARRAALENVVLPTITETEKVGEHDPTGFASLFLNE